MRVLEIFYNRYLTEDGSRMSIGGIETYITNLASLAYNMGIRVRIFQVGVFGERDLGYADLFAIPCKKENPFPTLYGKAKSVREKEDKVVSIIANDTLLPSFDVPNSITIQHGIGFDYVTDRKAPEWAMMLLNAYQNFRRVRKLRHTEELVCVDNNYICWYRTMTRFRNVKMTPILNFTPLSEGKADKPTDKVRLVFARRFVAIRGTRLFAGVVERLVDEFPQLEVTFAGEGPDEAYLKERFDGMGQVKFTCYESENSLSFHRGFDIAVVPTIFSEGTSLSLLEAMAARCAVVCTNVGGMTNIILDGFNGLMVIPNGDELYEAIASLVQDAALREKLGENAFLTVKESFSLEKWQAAWQKLLDRKFSKL